MVRVAAPVLDPSTRMPQLAPPGPLVAVANLCGGAGASGLVHTLATAVLAGSSAPVLAIDACESTGGLGDYAGASSPRSLTQAARALARGDDLRTTGLFVHTDDGLRVIASDPHAAADDAPLDSIERILADAKEAHALTVVDCGLPVTPVARHALALATHVIWLLPGTVGGVRRAQRILSASAFETRAVEIVCARRDPRERRAPLADLVTLAARRHANLALAPHIEDFDTVSADDRAHGLVLTLQAIDRALRP